VKLSRRRRELKDAGEVTATRAYGRWQGAQLTSNPLERQLDISLTKIIRSVGTEDAVPQNTLRLLAMRPGTLVHVRELTNDEASSFLANLALLKQHDRGRSLLEIVERNYNEFANTTERMAAAIPKAAPLSPLQREAETELNRCFLNFLAAMRQFLDHTEARIKRNYKHHSAVLESFQRATSHAFDTAFAYRFLYKVRNYAQHVGAPIGIVDVQVKAEGRTRSHILHLLYNPAELLENAGDLWGPVKADLKARSRLFQADPLAAAVLCHLRRIWKKVIEAERPILLQGANEIMQLVKDAPKPYISPAIARLWEARNGTTFEFLNPPIRTMSWLRKHPFKDFT
jgi:hypothetical protein